MKVHLKQIPARGLHLEGTEQKEILQLEDTQVKSIAPVSYSLDVGLSGSGLFATGRLWTSLEMECVKCLRRFAYPLTIENFATQIELTGSELVDLTDVVREDILLALPTHPHCDWDEKTVCPGPQDLVEKQELEGSNAWDALDELKLNRKN
jgi:uncharacterized protein